MVVLGMVGGKWGEVLWCVDGCWWWGMDWVSCWRSGRLLGEINVSALERCGKLLGFRWVSLRSWRFLEVGECLRLLAPEDEEGMGPGCEL